MSSIGKLALVLTADAAQLTASLVKGSAQIAAFASRSVRALASVGAQAVGHVAGGDLLGLAGMIPYVGPAVQGIAALSGPLLSMAAGAETAKLRMTALLGSSEQATAALADLKQLSLASGFGMDQLEPAARQMAQAGLGAEQLVPTLKALSSVSAVTGTSVEELASTLGRMVETGHVGFKQLHQLSGPVLQQLADNLGIAKDQLHEFVTAGKVGPRDVLKALGDVTQEGGRLAGALGDRAKSLAGSWDILGLHVKSVAGTIGNTLVSALGGDLQGGAAQLTGFFDRVKAGVEGLRPAFAWIGEFGRTQFAFFGQLWDDFVGPFFAGVKDALAGWGVQFPAAADVALFAATVIAKGLAYVYDACRFAASGFVQLAGAGLVMAGKLANVAAFGLASFRPFVVGVVGMVKVAADAFTDGFIQPLFQGLERLAWKVRIVLATAVNAMGGDAKAPAWLISARDGARDLDRQLTDMAENPPRWQAPDVGKQIDGLIDDSLLWSKILDQTGKNLGDLGKDLADAPFGDAADKVDAWFAKVRERAKGGIEGPEVKIDAGKVDLGAGLKESAKTLELKNAGALEQGSKEAYSAILRFQNQGVLAAQRAKDEADRKAQLLALKTLDTDMQALIREVRNQAQLQVANF